MKDERKTKKQLIEELESHRTLISKAPLGYQSLDESGNFVEVNEAWCRTFGYSGDEVKGRNFSEFIHPDLRDHFKESFSKFRSVGYILGVEFEMVKKDGSEIVVLFDGKIGYNEDGTFRQTHCILRDITERKRAEEALEKSEREKSAILDAMSELVAYQDMDHTVLWTNRAGAESVNEGSEALKGRKCYEIWAGREEPCDICPVAKAVETGEMHRDEITTPDERAWVVTGYPVKKETGEVIGVVEVTLEDTERKQAEEAVCRSEERHRTLISNIPGMVYRGYPDWTADVISGSIDICGYSEEELNSMAGGWLNVIHPEDKDAVVEQSNRKMCEATPGGLTYRITRPDGEVRWVEDRKTPLYSESGEFLGVEGVVFDITERKLVEEQLKESEEKYRNLVERANDGVIIVQDGIIAFVNSRMADMVGYSTDELVNTSFIDYVPADERPRIEDIYRRRLQGEKVPDIYEMRGFRKDGREIFIETNSGPITYKGKPAVLAFIRDVTERKQAAEALRQSEFKYRSLFEHALDMIHIVDAEGRLIDVNQVELDTLGYQRDEFIGRSVLEIVHPDSHATTREALSRVLKGEVVRNYETALASKDGGKVLVEVNAVPELVDGVVVSVRAILRDHTERKRAEQALRESEEKYRSLVANIPSVTWTTDGDGRMTFISSNVEAVSGYTAEEICGASEDLWLGITHPDDVGMVGATFKAMVKGEGSFDVEYRIQKKSGEWIWLHDLGTRTYNDKGEIRVDGVFSEITERKKAEEALRESEDKFRRIAERMFDVIFICNLDGTLAYASPSIEQVISYSAAEIVGRNVTDLVPESEIPHVTKVFEAIAAGKSVEGGVCRLRRKDGSFADTEVNAVPVFKDGTVVGGQAIIRDVTETKRLRELESRAQRLETAGRVAGQVAHDFNNLLAPIMAYPDLIRDELSGDHPALAYVGDIENSARQIAEINQQLLTLGRRGHYNLELLNLNEIVLQVIKQMDPLPQTLVCETDLDSELMNVMGGRSQIFRVLVNLLNNARDAMGDVGKLVVRSKNFYVDGMALAYGRVPKGEYVKLTVADTGCGVPDEILQNIFDPFFTSKVTDLKRGSGLGLSVVEAVMKDHKGYIDLITKAGEGTSFFLYFPATEDSADIPELDRPARGTETILVVDDDQVQRNVYLQLLGGLGYRIHAVESGEKAIEHLKDNPTDLLILDMIMKDGMDGTETYCQALKWNPNQKAILVSGYAYDDRVQAAHAAGAGAFIRKPLTRKMIAAAVRRELDRSVQPVVS
ncbi:MAG: PAS domain S-box protein [Candidatus Zixiibacteriota bacterium]|nr:MAG: PAS domain S-box protein [candidate division Zixibacteria bacterium]